MQHLNYGNTALTYAGRDGLIDVAQLLLCEGADVNRIDGEGETPLILAAFRSHPDEILNV